MTRRRSATPFANDIPASMTKIKDDLHLTLQKGGSNRANDAFDSLLLDFFKSIRFFTQSHVDKIFLKHYNHRAGPGRKGVRSFPRTLTTGD